MMISMTGYGSSSYETEDMMLKVEIKSLNSKFLDLKSRIPSKFAEKEIEIQNLVEKKLQRGKIDLTITVKYYNPDLIKKIINKDLLKSYYNDIRTISSDLEIKEQNVLSLLMTMPEVFTTQNENGQLTEEEWKTLNVLLTKALEDTLSYRLIEGEKLSVEIMNYLSSIESNQNKINKIKDNRIARITERLENKLK